MKRNKKLKMARISADLTQIKLAEKCAVPLWRIQKMEAGYIEPHIDEMRAIAKTLKIGVLEIFEELEDQKISFKKARAKYDGVSSGYITGGHVCLCVGGSTLSRFKTDSLSP